MATEPPARLVELLDTFLFNELEGVQERVETVISPYSMASDVNFVLDRLTPKLSLFAGGSGQAFKFAPLIGDSLARLASGEQPAVDLSCWSHLRAAVRAGPLTPHPMPDIPTNQRSWWRQPPLWVGAVPLLIFLLVSAIDLALAKQFTDNGKAVISDALGGVWQWMVVLLFLIALILAISPVGTLRLGGAEAKPSLKFFDWCAVLICTLLAGGGVFWSAAEPLYHFQTPSPVFEGVEGSTAAAVDPALAVSFLHWGFLAWALVATTTTITFSILERRGEPLRPRSLLVNIVPRSWVDGPLGHLGACRA